MYPSREVVVVPVLVTVVDPPPKRVVFPKPFPDPDPDPLVSVVVL